MIAARMMDADGNPLQRVKVEGVGAILDVSKTATVHPVFRKDTATYLFAKALERDQRYALVTEPQSGLVAQVSTSGAQDAHHKVAV